MRSREDDPLAGKHRGVVYSLAPSYRNARMLWAGTDDGLVWVTRDAGAHWKNVTPPELGAWSRVTQIDASHFDERTAYVAVSRQRLDDRSPYVYRTRDGGATWRRIDAGLPADEPVNVVREDPVRRGLLFAGTERSVYASPDDGARWQSLQRNLPPTSIRDLVVHGDDIVVATHGRSFWILDDVAPLRQAHATATDLYAPATAYRVRRDTWTDTPLPPEEPVGTNPPDGAILDYTLPADTAGPVEIEIRDRTGRVVREFSSADREEPYEPDMDVPTYWVRPRAIPPATPGDHRFVWDLTETPPRSVDRSFPISAIVHATPRSPEGVLVLPGTYTARLRANGRVIERPLHVAMDPRVRATPAELRAAYDLARELAGAMTASYDAMRRAEAAKDAAGVKRFASLNASASRLYGSVTAADAAPTAVQRSAAARLRGGVAKAQSPGFSIDGVDEP